VFVVDAFATELLTKFIRCLIGPSLGGQSGSKSGSRKSMKVVSTCQYGNFLPFFLPHLLRQLRSGGWRLATGDYRGTPREHESTMK
jgi:hypothetical protein